MKAKLHGDVADDYLDLVYRFPLRPIRTRGDYTTAMRLLNELLVRNDRTPSQNDYLHVLAQLISAYEQRHANVRRKRLSPIDALKYLMHENSMNAAALGRLVGGRGQASMILNGKRELSKANIRKLADRFKVSPALFI